MSRTARWLSSLSLAVLALGLGASLAGCNGPKCGDHFCRADQVCCSDSCGICGTMGGVCPSIGQCNAGEDAGSDGATLADGGGAMDLPAPIDAPTGDGAATTDGASTTDAGTDGAAPVDAAQGG